MSDLADLVRRVLRGSVTPSQVVTEVRAMAPLSARNDRFHSWWAVDGAEILDTLIRASRERLHLSVREAVREAKVTNGKVARERIAGLDVFRVLPSEHAQEQLVEQIVAQAMPSEFVEPTWDCDLLTLSRFRLSAEAAYLRRLMTKNAWNVSASAREAGVHRQSLHALLGKHNLARPNAENRISTGDESQAA